MKNRRKSNFVMVDIRLLILFITLLITTVAQAETPKLLYVLSDIYAEPSIIRTYEVGSTGRVAFKRQYRIPYYGIGAVGLAVDSDSQYLFVTYESSEVIQIVDAKTMEPKGTYKIAEPDAKDLAGIVYDHDNQLLYCVRRNKEKLYVFDWDPDTVKLTLVPGSPFSIKGAAAYGIALDEINDLLYVANHSRTVRIYNTSDWSEAGTIDLTFVAVSIAVDVVGGFVYTGGGYANNSYLTQYDMAADREKKVQMEDGGVIGLCMDQATGYVYVTTGVNDAKGGDDLFVYDSSLKVIDAEHDIGNPTGLVIPCPTGNRFHLAKTVVAGIIKEIDGLKYVNPGGTLVYNILFDCSNLERKANNVSVVDVLPPEVSFVTADGDGDFGHYDPVLHTYTWTYSSVSPGSSDSLNLTVQVKKDVGVGKKITNVATIDSSETPPTTVSNFVVTRAVDYIPLYISVEIVGGIPDDGKCVAPGDNLTYRICFDNNDNDHPVTSVSILSTLPQQVSFVSADGHGAFGHYDSQKHVYEWFYDSLAPRSHSCLELQVRVDPNVVPLTNLTNTVSISSKEAPKTTTKVSVAVCETEPLETDMCIVPQVIGPRSIAEYVLAVVALPDGVDPNDVGYDTLIMYPGDIEAVEQYIDTETCSGVTIIGAFDKNEILGAATHYGEVTLRVASTLKTGQAFYAETTVYLTKVGPFIWRWPNDCCP